MVDEQFLESATCSICGATAAPVPVTWMTERTARGTGRICPRCARDHLRAIEAKLDREYW